MTDPQNPQNPQNPQDPGPTPATPPAAQPAPEPAPQPTPTPAPTGAAVPPAAPVPPGPTVPPPASFGPPARMGKRTTTIVGAVVALTAVLGGGAAVANLAGGDDAPDKPEVVNGPGGLDDFVGPAIDPGAGPAIPVVPVTTPTPGPQPPPPPPSTTTTTVPEPDPTPPGGSTYDVGAGVTVSGAPGWEVLGQDNGVIGFGTDAGELWITLWGSASSARQVVQHDLQETAAYVQQLELLQEAALTVPSAALIEGSGAIWRGVIATSQGGAVPVEGMTFGYLRTDGLGIAISQLNVEGTWSGQESDVMAMIDSIDFGTAQGLG